MKGKKIGLALALGLSIYSVLGLTIDNKSLAYDITEDQNLYYGYNVTSGKSLMEQDALQTTFPIIDGKKTYEGKTYNDYIAKKVGGTEVVYDHTSAYSFKTVNSAYASSVGLNIYGKIYTVDTELATTFDTTTSLETKYQEYYDLYTGSISRYYYVVQLDTKDIRNFLSDSFKKEIESIGSVTDAKNVISRYGTHLNTGYTMGGRINFTNYQVTSEEGKDFSSVLSLSEKVSTALGKIQAGENGSFSSEYTNKENTQTNTSHYTYHSYGGAATSAFTLDQLFTYSESILDSEKSGFMYTKWVNSINNDQDLAIIGIPNGAQSIPLWNLLDDSSKTKNQRNYLVEAYKELCGDKYEEYQNTYKELTRNQSIHESDGVESELNGLYVRNSNNYFYYVDSNEYQQSTFSVSKDNYLYLDLTEYSNLEDIEYEVSGCEIKNKKNAIFKVTGTTGKVIIKAKYGENSDLKILFQASISSNKFETGLGTSEHPYVITTSDQFKNITDMSAYYILYSDIDFKGESINEFSDFKGTFNGNYYTISNLVITQRDGKYDYGLFSTNSGTIKNLKLKNVGTSTNETDFSTGGVDYKSNYKNDNYNTNSINAKTSGIICGINTGTIDNCNISYGYIRNVIKGDVSANSNYGTEPLYVISSGSICGTNSGTISNTYVNNTKILNSYNNTHSGDYTNQAYVYTGGLVGNMTGGTLSGCVYSTEDSGSLYSQNVSENNYGDIRAYSAGLIGYLEKATKVKNNYVYIRQCDDEDTKRAISFHLRGYPGMNSYRALACGSIVVTKDLDTSVLENNYGNAYQSGSFFEIDAIKETDENGTNLRSNATSNVYTKTEKVTSLNDQTGISSSNDITSTIKLSSNYFYYDENANFSKIKHLLDFNRKDIISISENIEESSIGTTFYQNEMFTVKGLKLKQSIYGFAEEDVVYFKLELEDSDNANVIDSKLSNTGSDNYAISISVGDASIFNKYLKVKENSLSRIYVLDSDDDYEIYLDQVESYISNFNYSNIKLKGVLTNGEEIDITQDGLYNKKNKLTLVTSTNNYANYYKEGSNIANVKYGSFTAQFILNVVSRNVESIEIVSNPTKTEYQSGQSVSLDGLNLLINYSEGDSRTLSSRSELNSLEIIGGTVNFGENDITLSYLDYSSANMPTFKVQGKGLIKFVNYDSSVISEDYYLENAEVVIPINPTRESDNTYSYTFAGWDKTVTTVSGDAVYTATYTKNYIDYTVKFVNDDSSLISSNTYHYGDTVVLPANPIKAADNEYTYTFAGWDKTVTTVSGDTVYTATYTKNYIDYTVKFVNDDNGLISNNTYHYGDTVVLPANPTKAADNEYTYTFAGWDKTVTTVSGDAVYTATYTKNYIDYTVKFVNDDSSLISSNTYHYGDTVVLPANPTKAADNEYTYTFAGWDKTVTTVSGDTVYTATYTKNYIDYTVKFVNDDNGLISNNTYHYGDTVVLPANPTKAADNEYTYTFAGWDKTVTTVSGDAVYTATYTKNYIDYTVKFVNDDSSLISSNTYHYGDTVVLPANPTKAADNEYTYTFAGWDKTVTTVTQDVTYKACYKATPKPDTKLYDELVSKIESVTNVNLETYEIIKEVSDKMENLSGTQKEEVSAKLNELIVKYQKYVDSINSEYEVAESMSEEWFASAIGLAITSIVTISSSVYLVARSKRWF